MTVIFQEYRALHEESGGVAADVTGRAFVDGSSDSGYGFLDGEGQLRIVEDNSPKERRAKL